MKVVIVGDGKVGSALTEQLAREGYDLVVIDNKKGVLKEAVDRMDVQVVSGNGAALETQRAAGVASAELLIAATSSDESNLLCCMLARKLGCPRTVARVRNPAYHDQLYLMREELGLSMTINPERTAANEVFRLLQFPSFLKRETFAKGKVELVELFVHEDSILADKALNQLYRILKIQILICAVKRGDQVYIPDGSFVLRKDDRIFVTAPNQSLAKLIKRLGLATHKVRSVMIVGGSNTAYYLTQELLRADVKVKIVEINPERCAELAERLPEAVIIQADGTDQRVLLEEGMAEMDAVVTLTNMDEENLIASMFANFLRVPTVITKINRSEYNSILQEKGIDCIVSPKMLVVDDIVRFLRALDGAEGNVRTLYRIADGGAEVLEFRVAPTTPHLETPLQDLHLRPNLLLGCISRGGRAIIPRGSDFLRVGDTVVVVATANNRVSNLSEIFEDEEL